MAKPERIPPLLACHRGVLTSFSAPARLSRYTNGDRLFARPQEAPSSAFSLIALKASIGLVTKPYVSGVGYMAPREECKTFSCLDISSCLLFVPIRDDPEMVVNLGLRAAEAGLQRLGVAA